MMVGVAGGYELAPQGTAVLCAFAVAGLLLLVLCFVLGPMRRAFVVNWAFGLALSLSVALMACAYTLARANQTRTTWPETPCAGRGIVVAPPTHSGRVVQLRLRLTDLQDGRSLRAAQQVLQVSLYDTTGRSAPAIGDALLFRGTIEPPRNSGNPYSFNYAAYLRGQGVSGTLFVFPDQIKLLPKATARRLTNERLGPLERLSLKALQTRDRLTAQYRLSGLSGQRLAVAQALTLGDRHALLRSTRQLYSETGAAHILALSGLHLGILFGILQALLLGGSRRRGPRIAAQGVIVACIWTFVFLAGMPTSLMRAAIMCTLFSLTLMLSRQAKGLNSLALAAIVLLVVNPLNLLDVGFQMSFGAVFVILCLSSWLTPKRIAAHKVARALWSFVVLSCCAQLGVAPLVAYYFHNFTPYFLLTNLVAIPMVYAILSTALGFFAVFFWPWAQTLAAHLLDLEIGVLHRALGFVAGLPHATLQLYPTALSVLLFYLGALLLVLAAFYRNTSRLAGGLCAWVLIAVVQVYAHKELAPRQCIWFYNQGRLSGVHFIVSADESYLWTPRGTADTLETQARARQIRIDFWQRFGLMPHLVGDSLNTRHLYLRHSLAQFGRQRVALLHSPMAFAPQPAPKQKLKLHVLYVCRGFKGHLDQVATRYAPQRVVLDASLPPYLVERFKSEARALGWPVSNLREEGALKLSAL